MSGIMQSTTVVVHLAAVHTGPQVQSKYAPVRKFLGLVGVESVDTLEFATLVLERLEGVWMSLRECVRCAAGQLLRVRFVSPWFQNSRGHLRIISLPRDDNSRQRLANMLFPWFRDILSPKQGCPWRTTLHQLFRVSQQLGPAQKWTKAFPIPSGQYQYQVRFGPPLVLIYFSTRFISQSQCAAHIPSSRHGT